MFARFCVVADCVLYQQAPSMPSLVNFSDLKQLNETREFLKMSDNDWDVQVWRCACAFRSVVLIKLHFCCFCIAAQKAFSSDPMSAPTQLTPRDTEGRVLHMPRSRVLPVTSNPREGEQCLCCVQLIMRRVTDSLHIHTGWKESLHGTQDSTLLAELNRESIIARSLLRNHDGFINTDLNAFHDGLSSPRSSSTLPHGEDGATSTYEDKSAVILDCKEVLSHIGVVNNRQVHDLLLASVYNSYSSGGEPLFTSSVPKEKYKLGVECLDYIMYSKTHLIPLRLLSLPQLAQLQLQGESPQEAVTDIDHTWLHPFPCVGDTVFGHTEKKLNLQTSHSEEGNDHTDGDNDSGELSQQLSDDFPGSGVTHHQQPPKYKVNEVKRLLKTLLDKSHIAGNSIADKNNLLWGGAWAPFPQASHKRTNCYLPNDKYGSTHLAICADFVIDENTLSTMWR